MTATRNKQLELMSATRREVVVQVRCVSRYFDRPGFVRALTNVTLEVHRGEVFGLLGPAGSGKSTLIRILAGQLPPSEGKAKVFGRSPKQRATRARVGYLPQHPTDPRSGLFSDAFDFLKEVFWLTNSRNRKPPLTTEGKDLRGILRQILIKNPELVLLDEPFFDLDPAGCNEVLEFIRVLTKRDCTVILSGSSLDHTKDICQRMAVLSRGQIEAIGTLQDLLTTRDGLHYVSDLLSQATAERALNLIRQDLEVPVHLNQRSIETQNTSAPETGRTEGSTPGGILLPLVKSPAPDPSPKLQSEATVNHEMLAALTRNPSDDSSAHKEVAENTPTKPDP
jgi:ABC-2 type transport system ATP-binding protein